MNRRLVVAVCPLVLLVGVVGDLRAEVTAEQARASIDRGVRFLKSKQQANGSWGEVIGFTGGLSSLCTLALLNAGVPADDDAIERALRYLRQTDTEMTYAVSLQTMVFVRADPVRDLALIRRNVAKLQRNQINSGPNAGAWTYSEGNPSGGDNSNTQFALLALYEAERAGVPIGDAVWRAAKKYWSGLQNVDGSWGYTASNRSGTGSMTCAGIASMVMADLRMRPADARVVGDQIECCLPRRGDEAGRIERTAPGSPLRNPQKEQVDQVDLALRWLGRHFSVGYNPRNDPTLGSTYLLYYLYGLERAGRLTARRFVPLPARAGQPDRADWYREGADYLVNQQDKSSGFWTSGGNESNPLIGTSFALLFLSKGRWPVVLGKLQTSDGDDWNRHRSDVANLTRYVETRWRRDLTWQILDLRLTTVDDLAQTPVLYLCGDKSPLPADPDNRQAMARKLRDYLDRGGFLMAEGVCNCADFDAGFRELVRLMFPEPGYGLRLLEPEHPIWRAEEKIDPRQLRPILGVDFGCRTSVVYAPADPADNPRPSLSCLWEVSQPQRGEVYSPVVQAQIDAARSLGLNVLAYATNRELKDWLEAPVQTATQGPGERFERGLLYVATLRHPGGCNVAPRAAARLMDSAARELGVRVRVRAEPLNIADDALFDHHLVFMHGRNAFRLTDAERRQLKKYVERGGTLLADSICASRMFTESFRREMAAIFPDRKLDRIAADDPMLGETYGGFDLRTVTRHDPDTARGDGLLKSVTRQVPPELEGVRFGDRWGVIFSPFDLSCALEKHDSLGCQGYTREDAARIGLNVVLYSLQQ